MEYRDITRSLIDKLNEAVSNDSGKDFFEALGFDVYDCGNNEWELSGIRTKGGVEMFAVINKESWIASFEEYYDCFDVDEEISIYRADPSSLYCRTFTCRQSVDDFEDWDNYVKELVDIANAGGKYKYSKHLYHNTAKSVLIFPKTERFSLEELDELEDSSLMDLYYEYPSEVKKMNLDEFVDSLNRCNESVMDKYVKFIK